MCDTKRKKKTLGIQKTKGGEVKKYKACLAGKGA